MKNKNNIAATDDGFVEKSTSRKIESPLDIQSDMFLFLNSLNRSFFWQKYNIPSVFSKLFNFFLQCFYLIRFRYYRDLKLRNLRMEFQIFRLQIFDKIQNIRLKIIKVRLNRIRRARGYTHDIAFDKLGNMFYVPNRNLKL